MVASNKRNTTFRTYLSQYERRYSEVHIELHIHPNLTSTLNQVRRVLKTPGCIIDQPEYQGGGGRDKQEKQAELPECK
jgi:hypothetical protein